MRTASIAAGAAGALLVVAALAWFVKTHKKKSTQLSPIGAAAAAPPSSSIAPQPPKPQRSAFLLRSQSFDFHCQIPSTRHAMFCRIARDYCPELFPEETCTDEQITIEQMRGGITNLLWKLTNPSGQSVLVRAYGENTEVFIHREQECAILQELSDVHHFAPKLYGLFANGRVEQFLDHAVAFDPSHRMGERFPVDFPVLIAQELKRMHSITEVESIPREQRAVPQLWPLLDKFYSLAKDIELPNGELLGIGQFAQELAWLKTVLPGSGDGGEQLDISPKAREIAFRNVFAHNDLLGGNILYLAKQHRVQFIDFEYGAFNYAAFDVANHFCEHAGFDFDLKRWYPNRDTQRAFWTAYVGQAEAVDDDVIEELVLWTNKFALAANALWFLWGVSQAKHSKLEDVDFFAFAQRRRQGYFDQKLEYFGL